MGNTEVAIGWQEPQLAAMDIPADLADAEWNQEWLVGGTGAMLLLATWKLSGGRRKDKRQHRLNDNYFTERVFDDLHTSMLPEPSEMKSTNKPASPQPTRTAPPPEKPTLPPEQPRLAGDVSLLATHARLNNPGTPSCSQGGSRSDRKP